MTDKHKVIIHFFDDNHNEFDTEEIDGIFTYNEAQDFVRELITSEIDEEFGFHMHESYHMEVDRISDFEFALTYRDGSYNIYNIEEVEDNGED